jgi:hypothetical protein
MGLILIAGGIFLYALRDVFTQFQLFEVQYRLLIVGAFFQFIGGLLLLWFFVNEFVATPYLRYLVYPLFGIVVAMLLFTQKIIPMGSEIQRAPLEPLPYYVARSFPLTKFGAVLIYGMILIISFLIFGIVSLHTMKVKDPELRKKGIFLGAGILFLILPMMVCLLISPIYARLGYLLGAFLVYKALKMKEK